MQNTHYICPEYLHMNFGLVMPLCCCQQIGMAAGDAAEVKHNAVIQLAVYQVRLLSSDLVLSLVLYSFSQGSLALTVCHVVRTVVSYIFVSVNVLAKMVVAGTAWLK